MSYAPVKTTTLTVQLGYVHSGSMTLGSAILYSPGAFKATDVGCYVTVMGCGTPIPIGDGQLPPYPNTAPGRGGGVDPYGGSVPMTNQVMLLSYVASYTDADHVVLHNTAACTFDGAWTGDSNMTIYRPIVTDAAGGTGCLSGSIAWDSTLTARDTAQFSVFSADGTFKITRGMPVLITDSEDTVNNIFPPHPGPIFGGIVDQIKARIESKLPCVTFDCSCVSWDVIMTRRLVGTYQSAYSGVALSIVTQLIYYHAGGEGFNVIQTGPAGPNLGYLSYDYGSSVSSALDDVATKSYGLSSSSPSTGSYSYQWYIDPWKRVYFVLQNTVLAPFQCEDATGDNSFGNFALAAAVTITGEKMANRVFVSSSKQVMATSSTETFNGDTSGKTTFNTANPIGVKPSIYDSRYGAQTVGVYGVDAGGTYDWYWQESSSSIYQDTSGTRGISPPTKSTVITVTYYGEQSAFDYYQYDDGVNMQAQVSGGTGYCDYLVNLDTVSQAGPPSDGLKLATSVATNYGTPPANLELVTWRSGLRCAQLIAVKLAQFGVNANFLIDRVQLATDGNIKTWTIHAVNGPLIGDWRTAMIDLAGGEQMLGGGGMGNFPVDAPAAWIPNYEAPNYDDPLFSVASFGVMPVYDLAASGSALAALDIYGTPPSGGIGLIVKVRQELVSGIFAQEASAVVSISDVGSPTSGKISFGASEGAAGAFIGRIISKLANLAYSTAEVPIRDFIVTANDGSGNFTVTPDPTLYGCAAGDLFTVRTAPTAVDAASFTDARFNNGYNAGLTVGGNVGNLALVIGGKGAGQPAQTVIANTATKVTVSPGWSIVPNATSVIILVEAVPQVTIVPDLTAVTNSLVGRLSIANYARKVVHVEGYTTNGREGPIETAPFREVYVWGAQGTRVITADATMLLTDGLVDADTTSGSIVYTCLPFSQIPNTVREVRKIRNADSNTVTVRVDPTTSDTFPDGATSIVLTDDDNNYFVQFKVPG